MGECRKEIRSIRLEADSACRAWYQLKMIRIGEGYLIEKASGAAGAKPNMESYFRETFEAAEEKFFGILGSKIRKKGPRKYRHVGICEKISQMELVL